MAGGIAGAHAGRGLALRLLPLAVFLGLYAPVIAFPYFWDDLFILQWVNTAGWAGVLTQAGFFRFRLFDRWLFLAAYTGLGPQGATLMHGLSLALGLINVALVTRLAGRSGAGRWAGVLAGLALAVYPTHYRNVAGAAAIAHLAVTAAALGAVAAHEAYTTTARRRWLGLCLLLTAAAPLAAESGIVAGPLVLVYWLSRRWPRWSGRAAVTAALPTLLSGAVGLWVLSVSRAEMGARALDRWLEKAAFFLQSLAFPLGPAGRWLAAQAGGASIAVALGLGLAVAGGVLLVTRRTSSGRLAVFGLAAFALASLPPAYALTFDYLVNEPHLFYFGSAGAGLTWAALAGRLLAQPAWRQRAALTVVIGLTAAGTAWTAHSLALYRLGVAPLAALARAAEAAPGGRLVAVNLPGSLAWPEPFFPVGNEGAMVLSRESPAQLFLDYNTRSAATVAAVVVPDVRRPAPYYVGVHGSETTLEGLAPELRAAAGVYLADYTAEAAALRWQGAVGSIEQRAEWLARFENGLVLETAAWTAEADGVTAILRWRGPAAPGGDATQFTHVFDCAGAFLGQTDGAALGGLYPLRLWGREEAVSEQRRVSLPAAAPACLVVRVGWYDPATGRRWAAWDPAGQPYPDDAVPVAEH